MEKEVNVSKETIVFDVDGVLLKWESNLVHFCRDLGIPTNVVLETYSSHFHPGSAKMFGFHPDDFDSGIEMVMRYNMSHYGATLSAYEDAVHIIPKLAEKYNLIALTCFGKGMDYYINRRSNLQAFFPGCFSELYCINPTDKKAELFRKIKSENQVIAYIDDQDNHIREINSTLGFREPIQVLKLNRYSPSEDFIQPDFTDMNQLYRHFTQEQC